MIPTIAQLFEEEVVNVIPDLVFDVPVILPADLPMTLNDLAHLDGYVRCKLRVGNTSLIKVAPGKAPEHLGRLSSRRRTGVGSVVSSR